MRRENYRSGFFGNGWLVMGGSLVAITLLIAMLVYSPEDEHSKKIEMFCAAGIRRPVEEVAKQYEESYGTRIELNFGGSGSLLSAIELSAKGDLYLAADPSYTDIAKEKGLLAETLPLAYQNPVIGVQKGNPKNISSIDDLARSDVTVVLANPSAASIGQLTKDILEKTGQWGKISQAVQAFKPTVMEVANDLKIGAADAGILWDPTVFQFSEIDAVRVPEFDAARVKITLGVLQSTKLPAAALRFLRYLGARDKGLLAFEKHGYEPVDGDKWAENPEITLFSGGVNRMAIKDTIADFEEREGVKVNTVYNGCGILVGQIKEGQPHDAYFSCDISFMTQVADLFLDSTDISETDMVLLTPKDNPKDLKTLGDLAAEGLQLGVANPKQSALGELTRRMLEGAGLLAQVSKNYRYQSPTADMLVTQVLEGKLDCVIVYAANCSQVREKLEMVPIDHSSAMAIQPFAVSKKSDYKYLTSRLFEAIGTAKSQHRFESVGFRWLAP